MKLKPDEQPWCPERHPEYLCLLTKRLSPPKSLDAFLLRQSELLRRLMAEADDPAKQEGNRQLRQLLPEEALDFLPHDLLMNPRTPNSLMFNPMVEGSRLHRSREFS